MATTLDRPATVPSVTARIAPLPEFDRSNAGYSTDLHGNVAFSSPTAAEPASRSYLLVEARDKAQITHLLSILGTSTGAAVAVLEQPELFADDVDLMPPVHRQRMKLHIRNTRIGTPLPDDDE